MAPLLASFSAAHDLGKSSTFLAGLFNLWSSPKTMMELQTSWCVRASCTWASRFQLTPALASSVLMNFWYATRPLLPMLPPNIREGCTESAKGVWTLSEGGACGIRGLIAS